MVEPKSSPPPIKESYLGARLAKQKGGLPTVQCPVCGKSVRGLKAHLLDVHRQLPSNNNATLSERSSSHELPAVQTTLPRTKEKLGPPAFAIANLKVCSVCGAGVKSLERHFKKTGHGPKPDAPSETALLIGRRHNTVTSTSVKCPMCSVRLPNKTQLASHVVGSHGRKAFFKLNLGDARQWKQGGKAAVGSSFKDGDVIDQGPSLDAKRHWGHSFRDHGQFGSYPSHDDMDDESSA